MKTKYYATIKNVSKLLKHYVKCYDKCKGKDYDDTLSFLEDKHISDGICNAFKKIILKGQFENSFEEMIFAKEFTIAPHRFNWDTPDIYYINNQNPRKGLTTRIRHLEKLLHNLQTSTNNSK